MDQANKYFRLMPGMLESLDRLDQRTLNMERILKSILLKSAVPSSTVTPSTAATPTTATTSATNTNLPARFTESGNGLAHRTTSSIFTCWFVEELHKCDPPPESSPDGWIVDTSGLKSTKIDDFRTNLEKKLDFSLDVSTYPTIGTALWGGQEPSEGVRSFYLFCKKVSASRHHYNDEAK